MAIDDTGPPGAQRHVADQTLQPQMIGQPMQRDPPLCLRPQDLAAIDRPPVRDDARNHPQPSTDSRIEGRTWRPLDQCGIEFVMRAVQIDIGARRPRGQQRGPELRHIGKEKIDESILGRANFARIKDGSSHKSLRIVASAMGRSEDPRPARHLG